MPLFVLPFSDTVSIQIIDIDPNFQLQTIPILFCPNVKTILICWICAFRYIHADSLHQKVASFMPLSEKITINISFTEMCLQQFSYFLISSFLAAKLDQNLSPKEAAEIICQFYTLFRVMVFSQKIFHDILRIGNDNILSRIFKENIPNWISELGPLIQATIYNTRHSTQKWL